MPIESATLSGVQHCHRARLAHPSLKMVSKSGIAGTAGSVRHRTMASAPVNIPDRAETIGWYSIRNLPPEGLCAHSGVSFSIGWTPDAFAFFASRRKQLTIPRLPCVEFHLTTRIGRAHRPRYHRNQKWHARIF